MSKSYQEYYSFRKMMYEYPECKEIADEYNHIRTISSTYYDKLYELMPKIIDTIPPGYDDIWLHLNIMHRGGGFVYAHSVEIETDIYEFFETQEYLNIKLPYDWKIKEVKYDYDGDYIDIWISSNIYLKEVYIVEEYTKNCAREMEKRGSHPENILAYI